jgi:hypothetical protein
LSYGKRLDSAPPVAPRICVDCGATAPVTNTAHTLISREHGWRLLRKQAPDGRWVLQWRCASCWQRFKNHP